MPDLPRFSLRSLALKWKWFFVMGSIFPFEEYFPLYMKQLGLTPSQIGMTWLFGLPSFSIVLTSYLADRFRARKLMVAVSEILLVLFSLAPLLALLVGSLQTCGINTAHVGNYSTKEAPLRTAEASSFINTSWTLNRTSSFYISKVKLDNHSNRGNFSRNATALFLFVAFVKVAYEMVKRLLVTLVDVANMTYLKKEKSKVGWYYVWAHVGSGLVLFLVGFLASHFEITICDQVYPAYFIVFPVVAATMALALAASPWMEYEYLEHRVINWADVRGVLCDTHYVVMLLVAFYCGWCYSMQYFWQYWFINYLGGGPHVLAYGGILRRFSFIIWYLVSPECVERLGELRCIAVGLLMFAVTCCALSFVHNPWLTLPIDALQIGASVLTKLPLIVHFSKPGTKASSAVIMGTSIFLFCISHLMHLYFKPTEYVCPAWL